MTLPLLPNQTAVLLAMEPQPTHGPVFQVAGDDDNSWWNEERNKRANRLLHQRWRAPYRPGECVAVATCKYCGGETKSDHNSFWCSKCQRLWPIEDRRHVEVLSVEPVDVQGKWFWKIEVKEIP